MYFKTLLFGERTEGNMGGRGRGRSRKATAESFPHVSTNREGWLGPGDGVEVGDKLNWDIF